MPYIGFIELVSQVTPTYAVSRIFCPVLTIERWPGCRKQLLILLMCTGMQADLNSHWDNTGEY